MIAKRIIEQAPDGTYYSTNAVSLLYLDKDGLDITFYLDPNMLYFTVLRLISSMTQNQARGDEHPETYATKEKLAKVMRAAVKGVLTMYGDQLLTLFYGSPEHPKPPRVKGLDIVQWYTEQFVQLFIANMMKTDLMLLGERTEEDINVISVNEVSTRPVTQKENISAEG
jgi:hypothetical protein